MKIKTSDIVNDTDYKEVVDLIQEYNSNKISHLEPEKFINKPLEIIAKNSDSIIIGGIYGRSIWGTLEIKTFVVRDEFRKSGVGTTLIKEAEFEATRRNCEYISLDTFSFQAPEFYEKMGFIKIGTETNFPKGFDKIYYRKKI